MCGLQHYQQEGQKCIMHLCRINVGGSGRKGKIMNDYQLLDQLAGSQPYNEMRIPEKVVLEENQGFCFGHHIQLTTRHPSGVVRQPFDSYLLTYLSSLNARARSFSSFFIVYASQGGSRTRFEVPSSLQLTSDNGFMLRESFPTPSKTHNNFCCLCSLKEYFEHQ